MNERVVLLLPPAVALVGMRLVRLLLGVEFQARYGMGVRFAIGLGVGMLVFTQTVLATTLMGWSAAGFLAKTALVWGFIEFLLLARAGAKQVKPFKFDRAQLWFLLLLPVFYYFWVFGRLSLVEGTMEFDAATHWLIKSKIMYLSPGHEFRQLIHDPSLAYVHWDYPLLVPALYTLNYGMLGSVNEFVNKVWPFWMMLALCLATLSLAEVWRRPRPRPIAVVIILCFLPATLRYIHMEGGTIPMVFYASLAALLLVQALAEQEITALAASVLLLAGCAMAKFEGMVYVGLWACVLLPVCWRRQWLRNAPLARAAALAALCLLPYVAFRLNSPIRHPESNWPSAAVHSPGAVLQRFPTILGVGLGRRFFSRDFANWTDHQGKLHWVGRPEGLDTVANYQLDLLPWLTVVLLGVSLWRRHHWRTVLQLTGVIFGVFVFLAFVIACLPQLFPQGTEAGYVIAKTGDDMGRYFYPFFVAWFLGIVAVWSRNDLSPTAADTARPDGSNPV